MNRRSLPKLFAAAFAALVPQYQIGKADKMQKQEILRCLHDVDFDVLDTAFEVAAARGGKVVQFHMSNQDSQTYMRNLRAKGGARKDDIWHDPKTGQARMAYRSVPIYVSMEHLCVLYVIEVEA